MKQLIKSALTLTSDTVFRIRGYRFPDYIVPRNRIDLLLLGNEQDVVNVMKRNLKSGMCVLDVGANIGLITRICAKKVSPVGQVVAFEPDPYTRSFLEHNVKKQKNVTVSPVALSNEDILAGLHIHPRSGTSNSLIAFDGAKETVEVECKKLDTYLQQHPDLKPDYIKIDVEGAELKVLGGMRETIARLPDLKIVIEYCPENLANGGVTPADYFGLLKEFGLRPHIIKMDGRTEPVADLADLNRKLGTEVYCNLLCDRGN